MTKQTCDDIQQGQMLQSKELNIEEVRASYTQIRQRSQSISKVQIFTKVGPSMDYKQCQKLPSKKFVNCDKTKNNINKQKIYVVKKKKNKSDEQYNVKNQKKDRNVTSNLIHHLVKYLSTIKGQKQTVIKILENHKLQSSYQQFKQQLQNLCKGLKTYVTINHINDLWFNSDKEKQQFCLIMRILSRRFFNKNCFLSIFFSNKFNKASKNVHIKGLRSLIDVLHRKDLDQLRAII